MLQVAEMALACLAGMTRTSLERLSQPRFVRNCSQLRFLSCFLSYTCPYIRSRGRLSQNQTMPSSFRKLLSRRGSKQQTEPQPAEVLSRRRLFSASNIHIQNPEDLSTLTRACYNSFSPSQKEEFDLHVRSPEMSASISGASSQQQDMDVSPPPSLLLSSPEISPSMIPAPLRRATSRLEVTISKDFDPSLVPAPHKWNESKPQDISSRATGTPDQEKNFSRPFTVGSPAPPSAPPSAPKTSEATQPFQSSERGLQDVQSIQAPTSGKKNYSVRRMCFKRGQRIHIALEDIQGVKKSSDQFYRDRAALKRHVLVGRPSDGDILLGQILLPEAVICKDPEREEYAWQVYDDPRFEPATKKNLDSIDKLWALFSSLCRSGIHVERIRPEHVLIHDFARESSWTSLMLESKRIEDMLRLVHVWTANEEEQSFQAHHLPRIIEKFRASLPSGLQQASFREPTDNLWHCRELSDEAIEICDEGFPTRRMLEDHLVERHWVSKEEIYKEFQDDPHEEGLAEVDYRLLRFSAMPQPSV